MPTFDTPEPIVATLDIGVGIARITAADRADTVVEVAPSDPAKQRDVKAATQTTVEFVNGKLVVTAPRVPMFGRGGSITVTVELPSGSHVDGDSALGDFHGEGRLGECTLKTALGHIRLHHTGRANLRTSTGRIIVDRVAGDAEITAAGDIRIGEIDGTAVVKNAMGDTWIGDVSGDARVTAATGKISIDRARSAVRAKSANGSIRVGEVARDSIVLETATGEVEVGIREGSAAWLDLKSSVGSVHNHLAASDGPEKADETVQVRARALSDIVIRRS